MSSSADLAGAAVRPLDLAARELGSGAWTRLGDASVLGDPVTEHALHGLAAEAQAAARAQGFATGWAEGRRAADERARDAERAAEVERRAADRRREAEHRATVDALVAAVGRLEEATAEACARVESHATALAVALTEELLGRELAVAQHPGVEAVRRALALAPADPPVRIRVAPEEATDPGLARLAGPAVVVADPALGRGEVLVEAATAVVDGRVAGALDRVREVLAP